MAAVQAKLDTDPGAAFVRRANQLIRTYRAWQGFAISLERLLEQLENDDDSVVELMRNVGSTSKREQFITLLDQATVAYSAGIGAVIDQARSLARAQSTSVQDEYEAQTRTVTKTVRGAVFLAKLRNYVLHYLAAPWTFKVRIEHDKAHGSVLLDSADLLNLDWSRDARTFIEESGDSIHLLPLLAPYRVAMDQLIQTLLDNSHRANEKAIEIANGLIAEYNLLLSGGVTDGRDWEARAAHAQANIQRLRRGEPQTDYRTGLPLGDDEH